MKITIEPSDPGCFLGVHAPQVTIDTRSDGETIEQFMEAMKSAAVAYGYSEETFIERIIQWGGELQQAQR